MNYAKWLCFDFDGVIATYSGWKGFDVLGEPNQEVISAMKNLHGKGYKITIFTTRLDTPTIRMFLKNNNVPYDSINSNAHNPPNTSQKPIYHAIIDDRAINYSGQAGEVLENEIEQLINKEL